MMVYLPIRNLGDFVITAAVIKNNALRKLPVILPHYLKDIFSAIGGERYFEVVGYIDYNIQPAFFEFYKVKDLSNIKRLLKDIQTISRFTKKHNSSFLLDYRSRRLFFTRSNFLWPNPGQNIYEGKFAMLRELEFLSKPAKNNHIIEAITPRPDLKVLILPDSRIESKRICGDLVKKIEGFFLNIQLEVAHFSKNSSARKGVVQYADFNELIALIQEYDLIISAESLPYHLANYLNKPHFVIYNKSRHYKSNFMTPFMLKNNYYAIYDGKNSDEVINELLKILHNNVISSTLAI